MRGTRTAILLTALLALAGPAAGQDAKDKDGRFQNLTVEQWTDLLRYPDGSVRRRAAKVLPDFGPSVAPTLLGVLHDPDEQVRRMAADGLVRFGSPSVPALAAALRPADSVVRYQAADAWGRIAYPLYQAARETNDQARSSAEAAARAQQERSEERRVGKE